ncbi:MAG: winged helix-turn-helix transcriptional regulator [bacterium]|nr:winged helix-turn-helix transcriptional regulator [bacterium]
MPDSSRSDTALQALAGYFRLLAEPVRLKIIDSLQSGELSVLEIVAATGLKQAHVSRQLGQLANEGLLMRRKAGTRVFYSLRDRRLGRLLADAEASLAEHRQGKLGELD